MKSLDNKSQKMAKENLSSVFHDDIFKQKVILNLIYLLILLFLIFQTQRRVRYFQENLFEGGDRHPVLKDTQFSFLGFKLIEKIFELGDGGHGKLKGDFG